MKMRGIVALAIEIVALLAAWATYRTDYGMGAGSAIFMLRGVGIGAAGLVIGGILGVVALLVGIAKNERISVAAVTAILVPLAMLILTLTGIIRL